MEGRVAWLSIAPVKALGLVHPEAIELGPNGVADDRRFLVVDASGRLFNGKRCGALAQVEPIYDAVAETLVLRFPDGTTVGAASWQGGVRTAELYGRKLDVRPVPAELSAALSDVAGEAVEILRVEPPATAVDRDRQGAVSLLSVAALDELARRAGLVDAVDPRRFRMLVGIDGVPANAEDAWLGRRVRIGDAVVIPAEPVGRCAVTTQHPDTGVPDLDTLRVIGAYRGDVPTNEPIPFGVWGRVETPGRVALGEAVRLLD